MRAVNPINFVKQRPVTCLALLLAILAAISFTKIDSAVVNFKKDSITAAADTYEPESSFNITRVKNQEEESFTRKPWQSISLHREWRINDEISEKDLMKSFNSITQIGGRVLDFSKEDDANEYNAKLRLYVDGYATIMYVKTRDDKFELRVTTE